MNAQMTGKCPQCGFIANVEVKRQTNVMNTYVNKDNTSQQAIFNDEREEIVVGEDTKTPTRWILKSLYDANVTIQSQSTHKPIAPTLVTTIPKNPPVQPNDPALVKDTSVLETEETPAPGTNPTAKETYNPTGKTQVEHPNPNPKPTSVTKNPPPHK